MKKCTKCGKTKPLSKFSKRAQSQDGYQLWCKKCTKEYRREYYSANAEQAKVHNKSQYKRNPIIARRSFLKRAYGLTLADYDVMLEAQGNRCVICGKTPEEEGERLSVDHDHETGRVRGLLCDDCNRAIGMLGESTQRLRSAANYLER